VRGGTAALSLTQSEGEDERVRGLLVTTDNGKHWRTLLAGGIPCKNHKAGPESLVLEVLAERSRGPPAPRTP
jgi:hypothetical protein